MDLISVIVPVYKVEKYLDKCVQSIVEQTYRHLEIILVDDGSPDNCPAMCDAWAQKDERIRVIHKENGGLSDARNAGMAVAKGDYIAFVDSDDWVANDFLETLLMVLKRDSSDIAVCGMQLLWDDGTPPCMLTDDFNGILTNEEAQVAILEETHLKQPTVNKLYCRHVIKDIPFKVGKYHEDAFWSYQALACAKKVSVTSKIGYYYFQRSNSIMGVSYSLKRLHAVEAACERQEYYKKHFPQLYDKALVNLWGLVMYHGQQALLHLTQADCQQALIQLKDVLKQYPLSRQAKRRLKFTHRIWIMIESISLVAVCRLRNRFRIGM